MGWWIRLFQEENPGNRNDDPRRAPVRKDDERDDVLRCSFVPRVKTMSRS